MEKTRLKGGSLSGTYLCRRPSGELFVRKEASLTIHREYGFQRWYSQLKRLQRYGELFPGVFPKLISYGKQENFAYFDIEYIPDSVTAHNFLLQNSNRSKIDALFSELVSVMDLMHKVRIPSNPEAIDLYIYEEMEQKFQACLNNRRFQELISERDVVFNGKTVKGLYWVLDEFKKMSRKVYQQPTETFTHGNLTLENILYQPKDNRIIFVDPYEENVIDSALAEYSQILQSSNSLYEIYNDSSSAKIFGNEVEMVVSIPFGLKYFDQKFNAFLKDRCSVQDLNMVRLLEISQYVRMLPFKMEIDEDKMVFFYVLGSHLFDNLKQDWSV
ncbi:MAG: phosphotransferase [Polaromonas sp.]|nr:phosphotransferase [Polaromonas sp.]